MCRLLSLALASMLFGSAASAQNLITVSPYDDQLRTVDPVSGVTLSAVQITDAAAMATFAGANGLALDPVNGTVWSVLKVQGSGRYLARLHPQTGVATLIAALADNFSGLAFDVFSQTLYGVTGDGANTPETLYSIDTNTGQSTFVMAFGNGNDGESITIPPFDSRMFHASGYSGTRNVDRIFERVDLAARTTTQVNFFGYDESEVLAMVHFAGDSLLGVDLNDDLFWLQANGAVTWLSGLDHTAKGLVFTVPVPGTPYYEPYGTTCNDANGYAPMLAGQNPPALGGTTTLVVQNAPGGSPAVILIGTGNAALSLGNCSAQILPLFPASLSVVLGGTGAGNGTGSASLSIPANIPPLDLYFQAAMISGGAVLASNPLHVHIN